MERKKDIKTITSLKCTLNAEEREKITMNICDAIHL